jgi:hypothetical protein
MKQAFLTALVCSTICALGAPLEVKGLRTESATNPIGVSNSPRLSWKLDSGERGNSQSAYEILAATSPEKLDEKKADLWATKKQQGAAKLLISWQGKPLKNGQKVHWKVRVWDKQDRPSGWSKMATFVVGDQTKLVKPGRISGFESSSKKINQLYTLSVADLEKRLAAFTEGDAAALGDGSAVHRSARAFLYHFDSVPHLTAWLRSMDAEITKDNFFPIHPGAQTTAPISSDAGVLVTHPLWWMSGDAQLTRSRWDTYEGHIIAREAQDLLLKGTKWGGMADSENVSAEFIDLCYLGFSCRLVLELALPAVQPQKAIRFQVYASRIRKSFEHQFVNADGSLKSKSQTGHVLALRSAVLNPKQKAKVLADLIALVEKNGSKVGPIGAHFLPGVLSLTGNQNLALKTLTNLTEEEQKTYVESGIAEWLMTFVAGIDTIVPGFNQAIISPRIPSDDSLTWVKAYHDSPTGKISVYWEKLAPNSALKAEIVIPAGTLSRVILPIGKNQTITEGGKKISDAVGVEIIEKKDGRVSLITQSGKYSFLIE